MTRILLATDGSRASDGAVRIVQRLADRDDAAVIVLGVVEPGALQGTGSLDADLLEGYRSLILDRASSLRVNVILDSNTRVEVGPVAATIARTASEIDAALIVLGKRTHGRLDQWIGNETAVRVAHIASVPIMVVQDGTDLPRRVLLCTDFSSFSVHALDVAITLAGRDAELHIAHVVQPPGQHLGEWTATLGHFMPDLREQIEVLQRETEQRYALSLTPHLEAGEPVPELLRLAEKIGADLIAAGSHGRGFFARHLLGSVSTRLLRAAPCSVLIVPPSADREMSARATRRQAIEHS